VEIFSVRKEYLDFVGKSVDASVAKARKVVIELNTFEPLGTLNSIVKEASRLLRNEFFLWKVMEEGLEYSDSSLKEVFLTQICRDPSPLIVSVYIVCFFFVLGT